MSPVWKKPLPFLSKEFPAETRLQFFYDAAQVEYKHRYPSDVPFAPLASAGLGIRASFANNFSFSADYGWQLTHLPQEPRNRSRGHIKVVLAY
jgi:hemolysin activation/secretion protein